MERYKQKKSLGKDGNRDNGGGERKERTMTQMGQKVREPRGSRKGTKPRHEGSRK